MDQADDSQLRRILHSHEPFNAPTQPIKLPSHTLIAGGTNSGKTVAVSQLFADCSNVFNPVPKKIIVCYENWQDLYRQMEEAVTAQGIQFELKQGSDFGIDALQPDEASTDNYLCLFDDSQQTTANSQNMIDVITKGRHRGISAWVIWHQIFPRSRYGRLIGLQFNYYILTNSPRVRSQIPTLANQLAMKQLTTAYTMMERLHDYSYLFVDLSKGCPEFLRLSSNLTEGVLGKYRHVFV
jgi:hypothetical protein